MTALQSIGVTLDAAALGATAFRAAIQTNPFSVLGADGGKLLAAFIRGFAANERQRWPETIRESVLEEQIAVSRPMGYAVGILATTNRNAGPISRAAVQHVATQPRQETFNAIQDVVTSVEWVSTLDNKTTTQCCSLDKPRFKLHEGPHPPLHINYRSTMVAVDSLQRAIRPGRHAGSGWARWRWAGSCLADLLRLAEAAASLISESGAGPQARKVVSGWRSERRAFRRAAV